MERSPAPDYVNRLLLAALVLGVLGLLVLLSRRRVKFEVEVEIEPPGGRESHEDEDESHEDEERHEAPAPGVKGEQRASLGEAAPQGDGPSAGRN